eukprot:TRINITY_DN7420_c0_g1_i3.p1 TRINITY_DN7420_c0_g1~~TRINITY_DN7420_c0_g1_i3.p1  ORF type:complete len:217 (-),score=31.66 TRINITY_DN7420_c0_g1_i3:46-696(-)
MNRSHYFLRLGDYPTPILGDTPALSYDPPTPSPAASVLSPPSFLELTANHSLHSNAFSFLYAFTIALNVVIVTWTVCVAWEKETPTSVLFVEFFINSVLTFEVFCRMIVFKQAFLRSLSNIFDVIVAVFCYGSLICLWFDINETPKDGLPAMFLRLTRDIIRFCRLMYLIRKQQQRVVRSRSHVDFKLLPSNNPEASLSSTYWDSPKSPHENDFVV